MELNTSQGGSQVPESRPAKTDGRVISGFWRRLFASFLDDLILGLGGWILGAFFFDFFARAGGWGRLFGLAIALVYFGILNSRFSNGQTVGKRALKIKVVGRDGSSISLGRSFVRTLILTVPFFLNNAMLPPSLMMSFVSTVVTLIVFGMGGAIIYLFLFNRRTRQSLHDIVVGTYVVKSSAVGTSVPPVWKGHLVIAGVLVASVFVFATIVVPRLAQRGPFPELFTVLEAIQNSGKVHTAKVFVGKTWGPHGESKDLTIDAIWKGRPSDFAKATEEIASIVLAVDPHIMEKDSLGVMISYGFDMGIARAWRNYSAQYSPKEWQERIARARRQPIKGNS